ncbi:MAG: hypothetical protein AMJ93_08100, partial [Anaerolineae bacterium SM23_84]
SALELHIRRNGSFRSFTASTQRETQARIRDILRMDYDTFINSALLLQGRADEFTMKPPAERKRILADILGLSIYDEYEERAKELIKEKEQAEREVQARIQEIERELQHRKEYRRELKAAKAELGQLSSRAKDAETELQGLRDTLKTLEAQKLQLADVEQRIQGAEVQLRDLDLQIQSHSQRLAAHESVLERREQIQAGHTRLLQARDEEAVYSAKLPQLLSLREDAMRLEKAITETRQGLELQAHILAERAAELQEEAAQRPQLQSEHAQVSQQLHRLAALQTKVQQARQTIAELSSERSKLDARNKDLIVEMKSLEEKLSLLRKPTATCPLCYQDLSEDDRQRLLVQFRQDGRKQGDEYRANRSRLKQLSSQTESLQSDVEAIEAELKKLPALQGREATLRKAIQEAEEAGTRLEEQQLLLTSLRYQIEHRDFAAEEQQQLTALQARISALEYDSAAHEQLRQTLKALEHFEADRAELERAQEMLTELRSNQQQLLKTRQQWAATLAADTERHAELAAALAGFEGLAHSLQAKQQEADEIRSREGHARQVLGAAQQKLDYCRFLARERRDRARQQKTLAEERGLYDELRVAFGKRGLQALIIETVIPELEEEANELLSRMTDGRMTVHFETQRDTKAGSTIETLDIKISDEHGARSYEMYSGGEAFRINFAIRIALSKLLARRAGAQLQTLIIDEGFGTQDTDGRQKLVEAINSIKEEFQRIIVITHIEELRDAFPVRIDVYKTAAGSQISLN